MGMVDIIESPFMVGMSKMPSGCDFSLQGCAGLLLLNVNHAK
jgi:hypothetical protein